MVKKKNLSITKGNTIYSSLFPRGNNFLVRPSVKLPYTYIPMYMYVHLHACIFENRQTHVGRCSGTFLCYLFLSLMPWSSFFSDQISDRNPIPILQVKGCGSKNTVSCAGSLCVSAHSRKDSQAQGLSEGSPRSPATCASGNHAGRGQLLRLTVTEAWIQALHCLPQPWLSRNKSDRGLTKASDLWVPSLFASNSP